MMSYGNNDGREVSFWQSTMEFVGCSHLAAYAFFKSLVRGGISRLKRHRACESVSSGRSKVKQVSTVMTLRQVLGSSPPSSETRAFARDGGGGCTGGVGGGVVGGGGGGWGGSFRTGRDNL